MWGKSKEKTVIEEKQNKEEYGFLRKKTIKELILPAGIDVSNINHVEIISSRTKICKKYDSFYITKNVYISRVFKRNVYILEI